MSEKEATARIKINKLLEAAGWRFFPEGNFPSNIRLEPAVAVRPADLDALGENFEKSVRGFVDFLLLDGHGFPLLVLEAKAEDKNSLVGKEQARKYARSQNCRFVILSNGNLHYFWDLERGNPYVITSFPKPDSVTGYKQITPNPQRLVDTLVEADYIVLTQRPTYQSDAGWKNEVERPAYIQSNKLRFLRLYQLKAIHRLQAAIRDRKDRFLFEMATGTARRVLFLVDLLELEDQASSLRRYISMSLRFLALRITSRCPYGYHLIVYPHYRECRKPSRPPEPCSPGSCVCGIINDLRLD